MTIVSENNKIFLIKFYSMLIITYLFLINIFYFCMGDQLYYRDSKSAIQLPVATSGTIELSKGQKIKQVFMTAVERIDTVSVQWGTYYRPNVGIVHISLYIESTGEILMQQDYNIADVLEGGLTTLSTHTPLENLLGIPLVIEITSDSPIGQAASPLMSDTSVNNNLYINDNPVDGILCFSVNGTDFIKKAGLYWPAVIIVGTILILLCVISFNLYKRGTPDAITTLIISFYEYRFLFKQLIKRDFKAKYKRSVLGMIWSVLNPVFMMGIQYFVFSTVFKSSVPYYEVYLFIGIIVFNFFSEACNASLVSIVVDGGLINKVYVPKYMYTITKFITALINLGLSLAPLCIIMFLSGVRLNKSVPLVIIPIVCLLIFSMGLGLALASSMVFFRDTQFLWSLFCLVWMYATPIFYTESIISENFKFIFNINPLYHFLKIIRTCILSGISPDPIEYVISIGSALLMLCIGTIIFKKTQDKFILYL